MKQKKITARRIRKILAAIEEEDFTRAMDLCARYRISPGEWGWLLRYDNLNLQLPAKRVAEIIQTQRECRLTIRRHYNE